MKILRNGGRGVILMGLDKGETLLQAVAFGDDGVVLEGVGRGAKAIRREFSARELAALLRHARPQGQVDRAAGQAGAPFTAAVFSLIWAPGQAGQRGDTLLASLRARDAGRGASAPPGGLQWCIIYRFGRQSPRRYRR